MKRRVTTEIAVLLIVSLGNFGDLSPGLFGAEVGSDAVRVMGRVQLGATLTDDEVREIVDFLDSLTGELPPGFATAPSLPSGAFRHVQ